MHTRRQTRRTRLLRLSGWSSQSRHLGLTPSLPSKALQRAQLRLPLPIRPTAQQHAHAEACTCMRATEGGLNSAWCLCHVRPCCTVGRGRLRAPGGHWLGRPGEQHQLRANWGCSIGMAKPWGRWGSACAGKPAARPAMPSSTCCGGGLLPVALAPAHGLWNRLTLEVLASMVGCPAMVTRGELRSTLRAALRAGDGAALPRRAPGGCCCCCASASLSAAVAVAGSRPGSAGCRPSGGGGGAPSCVASAGVGCGDEEVGCGVAEVEGWGAVCVRSPCLSRLPPSAHGGC